MIAGLDTRKGFSALGSAKPFVYAHAQNVVLGLMVTLGHFTALQS
jgi:hypothetical protein